MSTFEPMITGTIYEIVQDHDLVGEQWVLRQEDGTDFLLKVGKLDSTVAAVHIKLWTADEEIQLQGRVPVPGTIQCDPGVQYTAWMLRSKRMDQWREEVKKAITQLAEQAGITGTLGLYKRADYGRIVPYKGRTT